MKLFPSFQCSCPPRLPWKRGLGRGSPFLPISLFSLAIQPGSVLACAACYGQSDSPMAQGMNWGIFSLLAVIVSVLGGIGGFFIFLARKSASPANQPVALNQSPIT